MNDYKLSYNTEAILGNNKKYSFHRRQLANAESLFKSGHFKSALEIYSRILPKIQDTEIHDKIQKNIDDIKQALSSNPTDSKKSSDLSQKKKVDLDVGIKEITERLNNTLKLSQKMHPSEKQTEESNKKEEPQILPQESREKPPYNEGDAESNLNSPFLYEFNTSELKASQTVEGDINQKIESASIEKIESASFEADISQLGGKLPELGETKFETKVYSELGDGYHRPQTSFIADSVDIPGGNAVDTTGVGTNQQPQEEVPLNFPPRRQGGFSGGSSSIVPFSPQKRQEDLAKTLEELPPFNQTPPENITIAPVVPVGSISELLSGLYYSPEWEKYKNLPVKDRRSGKDRRKRKGRLPKGFVERRSGKDRRQVDLFAEREKFLKQWQNVQKRIGHNLPEKVFEGSNISDLFPPGLISPFAQIIAGQSYTPPVEMTTGSEATSEDTTSSTQEPIPIFTIPGLPNLQGSTQSPKATNGGSKSQPNKQANGNGSAASTGGTESSATDFSEIPQPHSARAANEEYIKEIDSEKDLVKINLPNPISADDYDFAAFMGNLKTISLPEGEDILRVHEGELEKDQKSIEEVEPPEIQMMEGTTGDVDSPFGEPEEPEGITEAPPPPEPERIIHGVLELKPPEEDDAPFLTLTYDFTKIPHSFRLSKNYSIMEYSYYKYKPMLTKAQEFARRKMLKNALNYYRVIKAQNIPPELKRMINRNIKDITEFLQKYLMSKGG